VPSIWTETMDLKHLLSHSWERYRGDRATRVGGL
jgi:hypothetical protein